jgi:outer membrane biosynthesis protein TonB
MTGEEPSRPTPASRSIGQFRVKDENSRLTVGSAPPPPAIGSAAPIASPTFTTPAAAANVAQPQSESMVATEVAEEILQEVSEVVAPPAEETVSEPPAPTLDEVIATAPAPEPEPEPEPEVIAEVQQPAPELAPPPAEVKTVKVRNSVDVMAELEALRKRATGTTPAAKTSSRRDPLADLAALRPKKEISRTLHLDIPADLLPRAKAVRVTLSFEDGEQGVLETREQQLDLGDTTDAQALSVNLKIDLA